MQITDNQPPVLYLAIRLWSKDLKHLIPIPVNPDYRVGIYAKNPLITDTFTTPLKSTIL